MVTVDSIGSRVLCGTQRLSNDLHNGLRHASNRADAPQARGCEERRTGHSQRRRQRDLQDKYRGENEPFAFR
jgi:hypothetical protein